MIKPEKLHKGDRIAIVSLSWGGSLQNPRLPDDSSAGCKCLRRRKEPFGSSSGDETTKKLQSILRGIGVI